MTRRQLDLAKLKSATPWPGLQETIRLQLVGPLLLLCAVAAAETLAYVLAENPSSAVLWYVNLEGSVYSGKAGWLFPVMSTFHSRSC